MLRRGGPNVRQVHETGPLTTDEFARDYVRRKEAVVMRGGAAHWPAVRNWSFAHIASLHPDLPVILEVGNVMQNAGGIVHTTLAQYVDDLDRGGAEGTGTDDFAYLSIIKIFDEIPELRADVDFSLLADQMVYNKMVGWLGPRGTITGYHADWAHNLFCQIVGSKRFDLVPAGNDDTMYLSDRYDRYSDQSRIDLENWDPAEFPRYADAPVVTIEVGPGDLLYVPPRWWHHVVSLEASISANNFGYKLLPGAKALVHDRLKRWRVPDDRAHSVMAERDRADT